MRAQIKSKKLDVKHPIVSYKKPCKQFPSLRRCILKNQDLLPTTRWTRLFFDDFWGTPLAHSGSHKSYRPLCVLSFRLNYWYGGLDPIGYHLLNNLLHCVVSCLFAYLCHVIYREDKLALFGGLLFAVHPIHTGKMSFDFFSFQNNFHCQIKRLVHSPPVSRSTIMLPVDRTAIISSKIHKLFCFLQKLSQGL